MDKPIRVLIADDHIIVRSGLRLLLEAEPDIMVVGEALDGRETITLVEKYLPDVVLMDISMPGMDGMEATRLIKTNWPDVNVLVLTMHRSEEYFFEMLKAGAAGYILKGAETSDLIQAIHVVARGEVFLYPTMAQKLVKDYLNFSKWGEGIGTSLTSREKEVLRLFGEGFDTSEIAEKLVVSLSTVHSHTSNLMSKLHLGSRCKLIKYARQSGHLPEN